MSLQDFRDNRAQEKRTAVIKAATELFAEHGPGAVSMAALARAAGVSTATLYRHFDDKEAVFGEVVEELVRDQLSEEDDPIKDGDIARLRRVAMRYAAVLCDPVVLGLLRAVVADTDNSTGFRGRLSEHGNAFFVQEFEQAVQGLFTGFAGTGSPDQSLNVHQAINELRGMIEHFTVVGGLLFNEVPDSDTLERLVDRALDSWHRRWLPGNSGTEG